jgi:hypothetical protein
MLTKNAEVFDRQLILSPDHGAWGAFHAAEKSSTADADALYRKAIEQALVVKEYFDAKGREQNEWKKKEFKGQIPTLPEGDPRNNPAGFDWHNPDFTFQSARVSPEFKRIWSTPELNMLHTANAILALAHLELGELDQARAFAQAAVTQTSHGLSISGDRRAHWSLAQGIAQKRNARDAALHDLLTEK